MSNTQFISVEDALAMTSIGLDSVNEQEEEAIANLNRKITDAARAGRYDIRIPGHMLSHRSGPVMSNGKLLLNERMMEAIRSAGYVLSFPSEIYGRDPERCDVLVMISWRPKLVPVEA